MILLLRIIKEFSLELGFQLSGFCTVWVYFYMGWGFSSFLRSKWAHPNYSIPGLLPYTHSCTAGFWKKFVCRWWFWLCIQTESFMKDVKGSERNGGFNSESWARMLCLKQQFSSLYLVFLRVKSDLPQLLHQTLVNLVKPAYYDTSCSV